MIQYLEGLKLILSQGKEKTDRTGTGTISYFGMQQRYNLADGFPMVTTKRVPFKSVLTELLWFLEGSGDEKRLKELLHGDKWSDKKTIWSKNANAPYWLPKAQYEGDLGRIYGVQWRDWYGQMKHTDTLPDNVHVFIPGPDNTYIYQEVTDQLTQLIEGIKKDPHGRRHIITAWNPGELDMMALPPCHCFAQFNVVDGKLDCLMYQRSNDFFLGCPFNITSYALFTHMVAQVCDLQVGELIHTTGDAHIYSNHMDQVKEQLTRTPHALPILRINPYIKDITQFTVKDFELVGYTHDEEIKGEMAV
jgi:thymidylate synthase